ncbi:cytochrome C [Rhodobacteraceae bacterium CCMM004]|nr:cytochrome C [Rhodobacteraceae bacterium CCMM004]
MTIAKTALAAALTLAPPAALADGDVDRGAYLVNTVMACGNCHTPMGPDGIVAEQNLAGRLVEQTEHFTAIAPNITPAGRVADWTDAELGRAIREGIRPDGSLVGPPMPYKAYRAISDDDLAAIVAHLRTVPAVENDPGTSDYRIPLPPAYGPPLETVSAPAPGVTVDYGAYLTALAHCMECHSPMTPQGPDWDEGYARGGFAFHGPWGTVVSPNLTDHPDGLAGYSDAEVERMIVDGVHPDGSPMLPPMPYAFLAGMKAEDLDAIVLYLRSIPGAPDP